MSEGILYLTGKIRKLGRVDHKDAYLDTYNLERERGITIFSKQAEFELGNRGITLLDTPGHVDFSAEMERTLQVLDYAILVINGADGVQGHTMTLWRLLARYQIPTFLFINKMDQDGTDKEKLLAELKKRLSDNSLISPGKNRNSSFPFQVIGVQISILMIHPPQLTNLSSQIQNPFRQRSLTGIYVRKDTYNKFLHSIFKSSFFFMN